MVAIQVVVVVVVVVAIATRLLCNNINNIAIIGSGSISSI
jgi:hypothetical protein